MLIWAWEQHMAECTTRLTGLYNREQSKILLVDLVHYSRQIIGKKIKERLNVDRFNIIHYYKIIGCRR